MVRSTQTHTHQAEFHNQVNAVKSAHISVIVKWVTYHKLETNELVMGLRN